MAPKYCRFRSVGMPAPEHSKARDRADKRNLALGKVMSRMVEMLVYGVIASAQLALALTLLDRHAHGTAATSTPITYSALQVGNKQTQ
jgi:hypothetical protein